MVDTMREPNNYHHETKMKVVMVNGKKVAYNPDEEEDPRLVAKIMEIEANAEYIEVDNMDEYFDKMRKESHESKD